MILHAIPDFALACPGSGSWKAVHATSIALERLGTPIRRQVFRSEDPGAIIEACTPDVSDVIVEYSYWGWVIERLARERPAVRRHVRTLNAEALQHWHRELPSLRAPVHFARCIYGCLRVLLQDDICRRYAYSLLGINPWETRCYWRFLPGGARLEHMPYFCPWPVLETGGVSRTWEERERMVLCLPGGLKGRFHRDQVLGLKQLAGTFKGLGLSDPAWSFGCTRGPDPAEQSVQSVPGIRFVGPTDDVWSLLRSVRVVAVLTDLGFGLKTTVIDALSAGCHVIVKPGLWRRLPEAIQEYCHPCIPDDPRSVAETLMRVDQSPGWGDINRGLEDEAVRVLRGVLKGG